MKDYYTFGKCERCGRVKPLKNGVCADCKKACPVDMPDFLKDLFNGGKK